MPKATILIVDDEPRIADTLAIIFKLAGYAASAVYSGEDALACLAALQPSLVISDVVMPGIDGIELAKKIRVSYPNCWVLLLSGNADTQEILNRATEEGYVFEVLAKPIPPPEMLAKVAALLDQNSSRLSRTSLSLLIKSCASKDHTLSSLHHTVKHS